MAGEALQEARMTRGGLQIRDDTETRPILNNKNVDLATRVVDLKPVEHVHAMETVESSMIPGNEAFAYYMLNVLSYLPMYAWTVAKVTEHVFEAFTSETDKEIDMRNIKSFIASNFDNVSMEIKDEKVVLKLNDVSIEV